MEQIHQFIAKLICMFYFKNSCLDEEDPWAGILAFTYFSVQSTYHITLQATPHQMVFGCEIILNASFSYDWYALWRLKQELIDKNNQNKN